MIKASLNDYRQSPRKVRLIANLVKGKRVDSALLTLNFIEKDAAGPIAKLIKSALSNAKQNSIESTDLYIKDIQVNPGKVLKRRMPRARGSAFPIKKRTSHVSLVLEQASPKSQVKSAKHKKALAKTEK